MEEMTEAVEIASIRSLSPHTEYIKHCKVTHSLPSTVAIVDVLISVFINPLKHAILAKGPKLHRLRDQR